MAKQAGGGAADFSGEKSAVLSTNEKDSFYEKLGKLNESSGLSLLFNFRQAMFDLHRFYMEVINRGGFYQVTKKRKWDDVALVSNSKSRVSMSAAQLQNVYEVLILQYELMYCRKMPNQANIWPAKVSRGFFGSGSSPSCSTGKRKHCDSSSPFSSVRLGGQDDGTEDKDCYANTLQENKGQQTVDKNSTMIVSPNSNVSEFIMEDLEAPQKPRTGYHIFLRLETHRLKEILGESSNSQNLREMAVASWRRLPEKDKLPYIEASKLDKERYDKEMAVYKQLHGNPKGKSQTLFSTTTPSMLKFSTPKEADDAYHVSFEDDSGDPHLPDESVVGLAIEAMRSAGSSESFFQIDWDNGPPGLPY